MTVHTRPTHGQRGNDGSATDATVIIDSIWDEIEALQVGVVNAKDYGAVGNGSTDDTAALQNWLNATTQANPKHLYLPPGTYKITDDLTIPFAPRTRISGAGRGQTIIKQFTAGKSIFWFKTDLTHTFTVQDMWLTYNSQQTNSASVAIRFEPASGSADYFAHVFQRLIIENAYDGVKITNVNGASAKSVWETVFRDIQMYAIKHTAVEFYNTGLGVPVVRFDNFGVFNTNTGGLVSTGPMFKFSAVETSATMMDLEGWYNQIFYAEGGGNHRWQDVHLENSQFTAQTKVFELANMGGFFARNWQIYEVGTPTTSLGAMSIFSGFEADALFDVDQIIIYETVSSGTTWQLFGQSGTGKPKFKMGYVHSWGATVSLPSADSVATNNTMWDDPKTGIRYLWNGVSLRSGSGSPESVVTAPVGSLFLRTDGSTSTTLYVKTSGTGNTGWTAK